MQNVFATGDGLRPACVVFQIGGEEGQAIAWVRAAFFQHGADVGFALQASHRGAHLMAGGEKLQDAMATDET